MSLSRCVDNTDGMDMEECVLCGREVTGCCDGVKLTICCMDCCVRADPDRLRRRVTQQTALKTYHCTRKDLNHLNSYPKVLPSMVFQLAEVKYMGGCNKDKMEKKSKQQWENHLSKIGSGSGWVCYPNSWPSRKVLLLLERLHVSQERWIKRNKLLWCFILGDYLKKGKGKRTRLPDVIRRFAVLDRVEEIMHSCRSARPGAVFDFCLAHPSAGPAEFQALKNKISLVFRIAGHRIMSYLSPSELKQLQRTPLEREAREFSERKHRNKCMPILFSLQQETDTRFAILTKSADLRRPKRWRHRRRSSGCFEEWSPRTSMHFGGELENGAKREEGALPYER